MRRWLPLWLWILCLTTPLASQTLTVGVNAGNAEPYAFVGAEGDIRGIIRDIGDALGRQLGRPVDYKILPRKRLEAALLAGTIDFIPIFHPSWSEDAGRLSWSPPLFDERNRILLPTTHKRGIVTESDLMGLTLGTIQGYAYPTLEPVFQLPDGPRRDDAPSLVQNIQKLRSGRIDALVDSDILLGWQLKNESPGAIDAPFTLAPYIVSTQKIYWAYSPTSSVPGSAIYRAFEHLKDSGVIDQILREYR